MAASPAKGQQLGGGGEAADREAQQRWVADQEARAARQRTVLYVIGGIGAAVVVIVAPFLIVPWLPKRVYGGTALRTWGATP